MNDKPIRVLLVDDDLEDCLLTRALLADVGAKKFAVSWCATYEAALEGLLGNEHDICLLDYRLGARSGLELLKEAVARGCRLPIILLTGRGDREVDLEAMQAGAADYLVKGANDGDLLERSIRYSLAQRRAEEALRQLHDQLEQRVSDRTAELAGANRELQAEIQERRRAEARLKESLQEKEVLLREIHHRVKNNLQLISSLLKLQAQHSNDPQALELFRESQDRVKSLALIHEKLYRLGDFARIDMADYLRSLTAYLFQAYALDSHDISLTLNVRNGPLSIDAAVPCALLIHELVSNALKHAFPSGQGGIEIDMHSENSHHCLLVRDNGAGLPRGLDVNHPPSLGFQLINALVDQLDGTLELLPGGGTAFKVTFPLNSEAHAHDRCTGPGSRG